jgi:DNA polymerase III delta prime subunit
MDKFFEDLFSNSSHAFLIFCDDIESVSKNLVERFVKESKEKNFVFRLFSPIDSGIDEAREFRAVTREKSGTAEGGTIHLFVMRSPSYEVFHTLLKTTEEPSENTKLVFLATDLAKIPATFLSRVKTVRIKGEEEGKKGKSKVKEDKDSMYRKIYSSVMGEISNFNNKTDRSLLVSKIKALSFLKQNSASIKMIGENLEMKEDLSETK